MRTDPRLLRTCLGHLATGSTAATGTSEHVPPGAAVNSFSAISLDRTAKDGKSRRLPEPALVPRAVSTKAG
ncbi:hypothetical protein ABZ863_21725 [Saccharomonospora sp. NPDC046836]|uniref:hypothetical protein n=1 Tax=Saccharomonospora sp. NPDC046836 TaxID=3156921 RepID=UPI00340C176B